MNNMRISNEKNKRIILIIFLAIFYMVECEPISNLFYLLEDVFEDYNENAHFAFTSGLFYALNFVEAEEFMSFVYAIILKFLYVAAPLVGACAAYFGNKFYVYISEGVLFLLFILACVGKGKYEDDYSWSDVSFSADVWVILIAIIVIGVILLMDANVISINQAPRPVNMNQPYNNMNQPYNGYNQPQNNYMAQNPQMNNPYMANNQMNNGYAPNNQMANPQVPQDQMYNGYDPNNGAN